jgi:hypothetical protein
MKHSNFTAQEMFCEKTTRTDEQYNDCMSKPFNNVESEDKTRSSESTKHDDEKKLPTWAKVSIIVGALAVVGTLIYFATKKR